jgi:hypothetical protein
MVRYAHHVCSGGIHEHLNKFQSLDLQFNISGVYYVNITLLRMYGRRGVVNKDPRPFAKGNEFKLQFSSDINLVKTGIMQHIYSLIENQV